MRTFWHIHSQLQRAVLLGAAFAAVANLPPLQIAQRLDEAMFEAFTTVLPQADSDIVVINVSDFDAVPALGAGTRATIIGPTAIALGPMESPTWAAPCIWLLALIGVFILINRQGRNHTFAWFLTLAGPALLVLLSAGAFSVASIWTPVAAASLFLMATGGATLQAHRAGGAKLPAVADAPPAREIAESREQPTHEDLISQWERYRELPATAATLPELFALGVDLYEDGETRLAADIFMRIALVDPDFGDVSRRLVNAERVSSPAEREARETLRHEMPGRIGRYRLLEPIGRGATGRVYLAWDPTISRLLAVKFIDLSLERDELEAQDARERFMQEAELTGRLSHPNIVTIYDIGENGGRAYFAMEYLKGEVLSHFTTPETLLAPKLVLELGAQAADALDYAHRRNVIHRDIKPANIMYDSVSGDLKITDFGIARSINVNRTRTGVVLGTPSFMSPEQIEGRNVKGHTDLFALGVSLYELLTGQLPFRGNSMTHLMFVIANEAHVPVSRARPGLPSMLDQVIDRALHKDPAQRFQTGAEMTAALRSVARGLN